MSKLFTSFVFTLLPCLLAQEATADIYKFVGRDGRVSYTDRPQHAGFKLILATPQQPSYFPLAGKRPLTSASSRHNQALSATHAQRREELSPLIDAAASKYSLDPALLHAVIRAESGYNPGAVSPKGAAGLMQLMPATAHRFGVRDRFDPQDNIEGGARYLSQLLDMFPQDLKLAVAAYNSGEQTVKRYGNQIPPIAETQTYVERVLTYYNQ